MARITLWKESGDFFWKEAKANGDFSDDVPAGPYVSYDEALEDAADALDCDLEEIDVDEFDELPK